MPAHTPTPTANPQPSLLLPSPGHSQLQRGGHANESHAKVEFVGLGDDLTFNLDVLTVCQAASSMRRTGPKVNVGNLQFAMILTTTQSKLCNKSELDNLTNPSQLIVAIQVSDKEQIFS